MQSDKVAYREFLEDARRARRAERQWKFQHIRSTHIAEKTQTDWPTPEQHSQWKPDDRPLDPTVYGSLPT